MAVTSLGPDAPSRFGSALHAVLDDSRRSLVLFGLILVASVVLQFSLPLNQDVGWYLHSAQAFLAGGTLYDDIYFEMNLPLPLMLSVPPAAFAEATGLFAITVLRIYFFFWILVSAWLSWRLMEGLLTDRQRRGLMTFILAGLGLLVMEHFGQREHFLMIAVLPYLILAARRAEGLSQGSATAFLVGAVAAIGFVLKPHFLLVPTVVEGYLLWRSRGISTAFRPETYGLALVGLAYGVLVAVLTPVFFTLVAPMALDLYSAYNKPLLGIIAVIVIPVLVLVLICYWQSRRALKTTALTDIFCLSALALLTVYLVQKKGWAYHLYPTAACVLLFWGASFCAERRHGEILAKMRSVARVGVLSCLLLFADALGYGVIAIRDFTAYLPRMVPVLQKHAEGGNFYFFTTSLAASFPLANYAGVPMVSRSPMLWPLTGLQGYANGVLPIRDAEHQARIDEYETYLVNAVVEDLMRTKPTVVIVDERPKKPFIFKREIRLLDFEVKRTYFDFDYIEFFSADPRFRAIWAGYEVVERVGHFTVFRRR